MDTDKMTKGQEKRRVPKLRFPEYRGMPGWEKKRLGEFCDILQGYGFPNDLQGKENGKYPFCKVSDITKAVNEDSGYIYRAANYINDEDLDVLRAKPVPIGATIFAKIGEALRLNRRALVSVECLIDNNVVGIKGREGAALDYFVFCLSQKIDMNKHCGGAVPSVNKSTLQSISVHVPVLPEQQKISDCLSSVDALIGLQGRKVEQLARHKQALLQQLFPADGETTPRLRFPKYRTAPAWEEKRLGDVCDVLQGYGFPERLQGKEKGKYPFCKVSDLSNSINRAGGVIREAANYIDDEELGLLRAKLIPVGATIFAKIGEALRLNRRALVGVECLIDNNVVGLIGKEGVASGNFVFYLSQNIDLNEYCGGAVPSVNKSTLQAIRVVIPLIEEQSKIANCLSSLDTLIDLHRRKLEALKRHKQGLMQQLFPAEEEV